MNEERYVIDALKTTRALPDEDFKAVLMEFPADLFFEFHARVVAAQMRYCHTLMRTPGSS